MSPLTHTLPSTHPESASALSGHSFSARGKRAFTLVELISVMVVMVLVLTIAVGSHLMWKRHNALDAVEMQVLAQLSLARQYAITQVRPTTCSFSNAVDRGLCWVSVPSNRVDDATEESGGNPVEARTPIGDTLRMPRQVMLWPTDTAPTHVIFRPDGSCANGSDYAISFFQNTSPAAADDPPLRRAIRIHALTGLARALTREERESQEVSP